MKEKAKQTEKKIIWVSKETHKYLKIASAENSLSMADLIDDMVAVYFKEKLKHYIDR